ncbi:hypothetical protein QQS21_003904 [Conoideocrella luteorostrata]|uniref:Uncharacterized protein n=1 Tax=Conoideocrella luteorostrata TaxID=1105319 RepID=A0AAJ0CSB8_9HYPO|nr:hypothetical protein QQS21_003904 [Conoideocrella luteorostrata]
MGLDYASIGILSLLEPLVGIISACLPFMGPVVKQIFGSDLSADAHEKKRQNSDPFNPVITIGSSTKRTDFKVLDEAELENLSLPPGVSNYTYVGAQSSTSSNTLNGILVCEDIKVHRSEE